MTQFEEGKRYASKSGIEILVDRRTAKYLVVGLQSGEMKWAYIRQNDETEHINCGETIYADGLVTAAEPEEFSIKKGDYVETPRFLKVKIEKVFKNADNAKKQGYTEPTHYENDQYGIVGKSLGENRMTFAAYEKNEG